MAQQLRSDFEAARQDPTGLCPYCDTHYEDREYHLRRCHAKAIADRELFRAKRRLTAMRLADQCRAARLARRPAASPDGVLPRRKVRKGDVPDRVWERFIGIYFVARNRPLELIYLDYRYRQARACGWNPCSPAWCRSGARAFEPDESPRWLWWTRRVSESARRALVLDSAGIGMRDAAT
jgi:hypothetical protein